MGRPGNSRDEHDALQPEALEPEDDENDVDEEDLDEETDSDSMHRHAR
jgi:hypothetical protein